MVLQFNSFIDNGSVGCFVVDSSGKSVCKVVASYNNGDLRIDTWKTDEEYRNTGIGKSAMKEMLNTFLSHNGTVESVTYVWNGLNQYVMDWMDRNFNPVCRCPLEVQKSQAEDDWLSHMYSLDVRKFLDYFGC